MSQEVPYYLAVSRPLFSRELPTPIIKNNQNLRGGSKNEAPAWINVARYGAIQTMEQPLDEVKSNFRSAQLSVEIAAKRKAEMQLRIRAAATKLGLKPKTQTRSAASTRNEKPAWLTTRNYFLTGSS